MVLLLPSGLLVYLELSATVFEECVDLFSCSNTGIDISFGCLSTHLLRCTEIAAFKLCEFCISIGFDICDILQVCTFRQQFDEFRFVDHFLTGCIDKDTTLLHHVDLCIVDTLLCLRSSRDMKRNDITVLEQFVLIVYCMYTGSFDSLFRAVCIVSIYIHSETFRYTGYVTAYITESKNTEFLTHQFCT